MWRFSITTEKQCDLQVVYGLKWPGNDDSRLHSRSLKPIEKVSHLFQFRSILAQLPSRALPLS